MCYSGLSHSSRHLPTEFGMLDQAQLNRIEDPHLRQVVQQLANLLEQALSDNDALKAELQSLKLAVDNVAFGRAKYYAASTAKTYLAPLPPGYCGGFGPDLKTLLLGLHHLANVSQPALHAFLTHAGIKISTGFIGEFLIN